MHTQRRCHLFGILMGIVGPKPGTARAISHQIRSNLLLGSMCTNVISVLIWVFVFGRNFGRTLSKTRAIAAYFGVPRPRGQRALKPMQIDTLSKSMMGSMYTDLVFCNFL